MRAFQFVRASNTGKAIEQASVNDAKYLGGGTNLVDLMRQGIETPEKLVDVSALSSSIAKTADGGVMIGAAARNSEVAAHPVIRGRYPMLSAAILSGASGQIRNMATVGGNILQRTRCAYFYDVDGARCNKRNPGDGCAAIGGFNRYHAILGATEGCVATHPSDMCVALAALDAIVHLRGPGGVRERLLNEFYRSPSVDPRQETIMRPGELITGIQLPPNSIATRSSYRKVRDRTSYAFALISVAAGVSLDDGRITEARLALGGVSWKPWRAYKAEAVLKNQEPSKQLFLRAALEELSSARPLDHNAFKVRLAERTMISVLGKIVGEP